jgi:cytochrome P450
VAQLLKDAQISKDATRLYPDKEVTAFDQNMLGKGPPDQTRLRSLANQAFTPAGAF